MKKKINALFHCIYSYIFIFIPIYLYYFLQKRILFKNTVFILRKKVNYLKLPSTFAI